MNINQIVGSTGVRVATVVLAAVCVVAIVAAVQGLIPAAGNIPVYVAIASGFLTFVAFWHVSAAVYARWLRISEAIHVAVVYVLFGACYLLIIPLFYFFVRPSDPLRMRKKRAGGARDIESLERMG